MAKAEPVGSDAYFHTPTDTPGLAEHSNRDHVEHGGHDGGYPDSDQPSAGDVAGHRAIDPGQQSKEIRKQERQRV